MNDGTHDDAWCQNPDNVVPPAFSMQGHSAPLDLEFYGGGSFPREYDGDVFVAFHGSWNRSVETGYKVVRVDFQNGQPVEQRGFFEFDGPNARGAEWPHRPVAVAAGLEGELYVTSDASGVVFVLGYEAR